MYLSSLKIKKLVSLLFLVLFSVGVNAQGLLYNKLQKLEKNHPEKVENVALRNSKIFKKNPVPYYFLSKDQLKKFKDETEEEKQYKIMTKVIKYARLAHKYGKKDDFDKNEDWLIYREEVKHTGYFYFKENSLEEKSYELKKKFNLLMSNEESEILSDKDLDVKVPEDEKINAYFYGLPTGNEFIKPQFLDEEQKMLNLINEERKILGLSIVEIDSSLSNACRYHAYDMATQNYVDHMGYDRGKDDKLYFANNTFERIRQFYKASQLTGENISWGQKEAKFVYKRWYNSPAHHKNLFKPQNNKVGIGLVYLPGSEFEYYWVFAGAE